MKKPSFKVETVLVCFNDIRSYIRNIDIKDFALIKICLISFGVLIGSLLCKNKKAVTVAALICFIISYIPLMKSFGLYLKLKADAVRQSGKEI